MKVAAPPELALLVPVWNEAVVLPVLFDEVLRQQGVALELVFSDGGSSDASCQLIRHFAVRCPYSCRLVCGARGRAAQLNRAALHSQAAVLLFVHADSRWPDATALCQALAAYRAWRREYPALPLAGRFRLSFDEPGWRYHQLARKAAIAAPGAVLGDQGFMLERSCWQRLGGFAEDWPVLEDAELAQRLGCQGRWFCFEALIQTRACRYRREGYWRRRWRNAMLLLLAASDRPDWLWPWLGSYTTAAGQTAGNGALPSLAQLFSQRAFWCRWGERLAGYGWYPRWLLTGRHPSADCWQPRTPATTTVLALLCWLASALWAFIYWPVRLSGQASPVTKGDTHDNSTTGLSCPGSGPG